MRIRVGALFALLMTSIFAWALFQARGWPVAAGLFPWVIASPTLILAVILLVRELRAGAKGSEAGPATEAEAATLRLERWRTANILVWIFCFFLGIWMLRFSVAIILFTFLYLKLQSKESWWLTMLFTSVAWGFFYGLFDRVLHLPFPDGQLFLWFPWLPDLSWLG